MPGVQDQDLTAGTLVPGVQDQDGQQVHWCLVSRIKMDSKYTGAQCPGSRWTAGTLVHSEQYQGYCVNNSYVCTRGRL